MAILSLLVLDIVLSESMFLIDIFSALMGGVIIGAALGAWLLPAIVDRLHRGK